MSEAAKPNRGAHGRLDFVSGALMALVALVLFVWFAPTFAPGEGGPGQIAPSFFPRMAAAVMFVCALLVMARNLRALSAPGTGEGLSLLSELAGWTVFAGGLYALLAWAGFVPAGIFAILCGVALTRYRKRLWLATILAVGLPFLIDWGVWKLFWIELP